MFNALEMALRISTVLILLLIVVGSGFALPDVMRNPRQDKTSRAIASVILVVLLLSLILLARWIITSYTYPPDPLPCEVITINGVEYVQRNCKFDLDIQPMSR